MIRPFTLICMLLACGSGLYLYQAKHRVQLLDRDIAQTVQATSAARDRAGMLRTEWTLLNDLERLRVLADQHMQLRPVAPGQFTSLAELANRLPPPRAPVPETDAAPVLQVEAAPTLAEGVQPEMADLPTPPMPPLAVPPLATSLLATSPLATSPLATSPSGSRSPATPAPVLAAQISSTNAANMAIARAGKAAAEAAQARAAERRQVAEATPRPQPMARAIAAAPPAYAPPQSSSLGMAARTMLPPPVPVSAYLYTGPN